MPIEPSVSAAFESMSLYEYLYGDVNCHQLMQAATNDGT